MTHGNLPTTISPRKSTIRGELREWYVLHGNGYFIIAGKIYGDMRKRYRDGFTYYTSHIDKSIDKPNENWVIYIDDQGYEWMCFRDQHHPTKRDTP